MTNAEYYPTHCRTSCSDQHPINATAEGSTGCARCTALELDQGADAIALLRCILINLTKGMPASTQKLQAKTIREFFKENNLAQ